MSDDDYEHPVALPLTWIVVGAVMIAANFEDGLAGDWVSALVGVCGLFLVGMAGFDLFRRWRRRRA